MLADTPRVSTQNFVSEDEEINRVVFAIKAIRDLGNDTIQGALISINTFRWKVAEAAIQAGANCINDVVHAFTGREYPLVQSSNNHLLKMRDIARCSWVPVILMHS